MAAIIGLDSERVKELCVEASAAGSVAPANLNTPSQIVCSGEEAAVLKLLELAEEAGADKAIRLNVGAAFHSELMKPTQEKMAEAMQDVDWSDPATPLVGNATGRAEDDRRRGPRGARRADREPGAVGGLRADAGRRGLRHVPRAGLGPHAVRPRPPDRPRGRDVLGGLAEEAREVQGADERLMDQRLPRILGALVAMAAVGVVLALVLGGGDDDDDDDAAARTTP